MKEISLNLQVDEINTIIEALGQMPFVKVYKLIEKLHVQASQQTSEKKNETKSLNSTKEQPN